MTDWVKLAHMDDIADGGLLAVSVQEHRLVLVRDGVVVTACQANCPHQMAKLVAGRLENGRLVCPHHLASFSLNDGKVSAGWEVADLRLYPIQITDDSILVDADAVRRNPPEGKKVTWNFAKPA